MNKASILGVTLLLLSTGANAQVLDKKQSNNIFANPTVSELGKTEMSNELNPMKLNLRAVQEAFDDAPSDSNVLRATYHPDITYKLRTRVGMRTLIHLSEGELIKSFIVGNPMWFNASSIDSKDEERGVVPNMITIKPTYPGADTNLTLITESQKVYNFYLRSDPIDSDYVPHLTVYIQNQPEEKLLANNAAESMAVVEGERKERSYKKSKSNKTPKVFTKEEQASNDYLETLDAKDNINAHYKIFGDESIAPYAVYDDGRFTYFDYRHTLPNDRMPVIYKVVDGMETIVNFNEKNGFLVAESLSQEGWTLRNGQLVVCVKAEVELGSFHGEPKRPQVENTYAVDEVY